jgi:hypothetical protein
MADDPVKSRAVAQSEADPLAAGQSAPNPGSPLAGEEQVDHPNASCSPQEESATERVPHGTLSPERMREVLRHLAGTYDSVEVQDVIARRIQKDLGLSTGE